MAYIAPSIGPQGLSIPTYSDILSDLIAQYRLIYGQTVYLAADSADYQWISAVSLKISDTFQALQLAYNARSPLTAVGADLDGIVKLNGIARKSASYSTVLVTLTGTPGAAINSGIMRDVNGLAWDLPAAIVIPASGTVTVTATCETAGRIAANPGDVATIATPTAGWTSGSNSVAAITGAPIESDSQLRGRQALSVAIPARTMLSGTIAAIAAISTRYSVIENPTNSTDSLGTPPHSITAIVEGATDLAVATAIFNNRGIGCLTNGTTTVSITDPTNGIQMSIAFIRPTYVSPYVSLSVHALAGYTTAIQAAIVADIVAYLNSLQIGQTVVISELYGAALAARPNPGAPLFSIRALTAGTSPSPTGTSDITIAFTQVAQGLSANVVITLV